MVRVTSPHPNTEDQLDKPLLKRRALYPIRWIVGMGFGGITLRVMKTKKLLDEAKKLAAPFCVTSGKKFRLKDFDPGDTQGVKSKSHAEKLLRRAARRRVRCRSGCMRRTGGRCC